MNHVNQFLVPSRHLSNTIFLFLFQKTLHIENHFSVSDCVGVCICACIICYTILIIKSGNFIVIKTQMYPIPFEPNRTEPKCHSKISDKIPLISIPNRNDYSFSILFTPYNMCCVYWAPHVCYSGILVVNKSHFIAIITNMLKYERMISVLVYSAFILISQC